MLQQRVGDPVSLSDQCKAIILGSILGDGSLKLNQGYANARFSFRHSVEQEGIFAGKRMRFVKSPVRNPFFSREKMADMDQKINCDIKVAHCLNSPRYFI